MPAGTIELNLAVTQPDEFYAAYRSHFGSRLCCANLMAIGSTFGLLLVPALVGFLIHYLEDRVNETTDADKYNSRLLSLLIIFAVVTVFSALCE